MARSPADRPRVAAILEEAQRRGALGSTSVDDHIVHAEAMAGVVGTPPASACDLGSGGGVPGLVLALAWPLTSLVLVEAMAKRARWLEQACGELGVDSRCRVVHERAETVGRAPEWRERFGLVTARAFGAPPVTAECAAPLLQRGGRLVVSEPPERDADRWPVEGLEELGLGPPRHQDVSGARAAFVVIEKVSDTPERFPRRVGVPAKRPLW